MAYEIRIYPDPVLKEVSSEVQSINADIAAFTEGLVQTMRSTPGVGLAAPQVGRPIRIIAVDVTPKNPGHGLVVLINPVIVSLRGSCVIREGCLSIPEYTANIKRAAEVTVKGIDRNGIDVVLESSGLEAIAFQHEIDHLDGILFLDRITNMKRDLFRRKTKKL
jgi:peptide deformylase